MITIRRNIVVLTAVAMCVVGVVALISTDTVGRRRQINRRCATLRDQAIRFPNDPRYVRELLEIAQDKYSFGATTATVALGDVGPAARYVIRDLGRLMRSPDPYVRREAANSLSKLGPLAEPVLGELEAALDQELDVSCFAADAIGNVERAAEGSIPVLKGKLGKSKLLDDSLLTAIEKLEKAGAEQEE